ncbi:imidazoleglycerol-phosphate dehydratase HisB [candidate division FCPU426 bacterium]|nr:imidazoleglycerol-phosphate dehydratase HisB [candidate division FCPU426 bacterium]
MRKASLQRRTKETQIRLSLNVDGNGKTDLSTGLPFFEHMLELMAGHGLVDLNLFARGDVEVDQHHLVEDIGLALGQALKKAVADKRGIARYGWAIIPMDESLVQVALDLSGRPFLYSNLKLRQKRLGEFDTELLLEFLRALVNSAGITLHIVQQNGGNSHHLVEAAFKALGRALRQACTRDRRVRGIPSTKGIL